MATKHFKTVGGAVHAFILIMFMALCMACVSYAVMFMVKKSVLLAIVPFVLDLWMITRLPYLNKTLDRYCH